MFILLTEALLLFSAAILLLIHLTSSNFKYSWFLAVGGATAAFISIFFWRLHFPDVFSLPNWLTTDAFILKPTWIADGISWTYSLALSILSAGVIWTSVVRAENEPISWAGTLILTALGILAITAENALTMILIWVAIDGYEIVTLLRYVEKEEDNLNIIFAFAVRMMGTGMVIWAILSQTSPDGIFNLQSPPATSSLYLIVAAGLRLGILPLHLPYRKDALIRRGFGTTFRVVSATASLILLARIPPLSSNGFLTNILLIMVVIAGNYSGWMFLRSSDEILGRPFWILGLASLALAESLLGNPTGSMGWGTALILCGGMLFLFSARTRKVLWLPAIGVFGLLSLPYTITSSVWELHQHSPWVYIIFLVPAQILFLVGYIRHALHPGETSFESQEKWVKIIYPAGLTIIGLAIIFLGIFGMNGDKIIGPWWLSLLITALCTFITIYINTHPIKLSVAVATQWTSILRMGWIGKAITRVYNFIEDLIHGISSTLEGDGGLLWSFLLLVLIITILSTKSS